MPFKRIPKRFSIKIESWRNIWRTSILAWHDKLERIITSHTKASIKSSGQTFLDWTMPCDNYSTYCFIFSQCSGSSKRRGIQIFQVIPTPLFWQKITIFQYGAKKRNAPKPHSSPMFGSPTVFLFSMVHIMAFWLVSASKFTASKECLNLN